MTDKQHSIMFLPCCHMNVWLTLVFVCLQKYKRPRKANLRYSTMHLTNYAVNKASKVSLTPFAVVHLTRGINTGR
jgi:hypothetical protein